MSSQMARGTLETSVYVLVVEEYLYTLTISVKVLRNDWVILCKNNNYFSWILGLRNYLKSCTDGSLRFQAVTKKTGNLFCWEGLVRTGTLLMPLVQVSDSEILKIHIETIAQCIIHIYKSLQRFGTMIEAVLNFYALHSL